MPPRDFSDAVTQAADVVFKSAEDVLRQVPANEARNLVIDPLVDANTGQQTVSTVRMEKILNEVVRTRYPSFSVRPLTRDSLQQSPLLLIGTLTAINSGGDAKARPDIFRIWLTVIDLRTGKIIGKAIARATENSVDPTPTAYFNDTTSGVKDRRVAGYVESCQINSK